MSRTRSDLAFLLLLGGCAATAGAPASAGLPTPASASAPAERECGSVRVPVVTEIDGHPLALNGMAVREATFLAVDVYVGALYLERPTQDVEDFLLSAQHKRLELHFVRSIDRESVLRYVRWGFRNNTEDDQRAFRAEMTWTERSFSDYEAGDVVAFDYRPGVGITATKNGVVLDSWPGDVFAEVFFRIFVGPKRSNAPLRDGLLGGVCND